jgi:hypothetical protein
MFCDLWVKTGWVVLVFTMICDVKVMAADQVDAKAKAKCSLNEPSEKDGVGSVKVDIARESTLRRHVTQLQESLALANAEAAFFEQQYKELRLKNEMLGLDALTGDESRMQKRVLQSVKELYQVEKERRELVARLSLLIESSMAVLKTAEKVDPQKRADFEVALRSAKDFLVGNGSALTTVVTELREGQILHVNDELGSVILNIGSKLGVKSGMPFRVLREDKVVGRLKAFQVREQVSAALIEFRSPNQILKRGDKVEVAAEK